MKCLLCTLPLILLLACNPNRTAPDDPAAIRASPGEIETSYNVTIEIPETGYAFMDTVMQNEIRQIREEYIEIASAPVESAARYQLNIDVDSFYFPPAIHSYLFNIYEYTGGAHGNTYIRTFTFDTQKQREIGLSEIIGPFFEDDQQMYALIGRIVMSNLGSRLEDKDWVEKGTGYNPENYQNFVVTKDELVFYFPPYQIAPYSEGTIKIAIPMMALQ